jgi:Fur family peroxide stress response transcriptional regulator
MIQKISELEKSTMHPEELHNDIRANRLREAGLKATAPRLAILAALEDDRRHPTAEMVFESLRDRHPSLSLSTVYSTLESFIQRGIIRRIGSNGARLRVDGTLQDHDHAVCRVCNAVYDVERGLARIAPPPETLPDGLHVTGVYIEYEVICSKCEHSL